MDPRDHLGVTNHQALRFFFEHLKDVTDDIEPPENELLYNASVLAHFATTSTASHDSFPSCPTSLLTVFDLFVMDLTEPHGDPEIMEAAGSQCLLLTGFFQNQQKQRHQVEWYASLGMGFYERAAKASRDRSRAQMMSVMARRFGFWRERQHRLAVDLREMPFLLTLPPPDTPTVIM